LFLGYGMYWRLKIKNINVIMFFFLILFLISNNASLADDAPANSEQKSALNVPSLRVVDEFGFDYMSGNFITPNLEISTVGISRSISVNSLDNRLTLDDSFFAQGKGDSLHYRYITTGNTFDKFYLFSGDTVKEFYGDRNLNTINASSYVGANGARGNINCDTITCTYTLPEGDQVKFEASLGRVKQTIKPNGETLTYNYKSLEISDTVQTIEVCINTPLDFNNTDSPGGEYTTECSMQPNPNYGKVINLGDYKLASIVSNSGWQVKYENNANYYNYGVQVLYDDNKVSIINNSIEYCGLYDEPCSSTYASVRPALVQDCSTAADGAHQCSFSDQLGQQYYTEYDSIPSRGLVNHKFVSPRGVTTKIDYSVAEAERLGYFVGYSQFSATKIQIGDFFKTYDPRGAPVFYIKSTDRYGFEKETYINADYSKFNSIKDELGRTTIHKFYNNWLNISWGDKKNSYTNRVDLAGWVSEIINPDSTDATTATKGGTVFTYDVRGNVTTKSIYPKGGGTPLATTAGIPLNCDNYKTCNKPLWIRDPKGNQTDYTYDPIHGGVLTETGTEVGGQRPQIRYGYAALYAKIMNSSGVLVNADSPIYKLIKTSTCASSTNACEGTKDELLTEFQYNHNNLLLTTKTVKAGDGSVSAATSYGYDYVGNIIWQDGPRTDIDDKTYASFDHRRRPVFEIGPDPDGTGALKRSIIRHIYDADGNEIRTETGTGQATDGSDFVVTAFKRMTFDMSGKLVKTEAVLP
jgi:hypothetical protein